MNSTLKAEDMIAVLFEAEEGYVSLIDYVYDSTLSDEEVIDFFSRVNSLKIIAILR